MTLIERRIIKLSTLLFISCIYGYYCYQYQIQLHNLPLLTGWTLLTLLVLSLVLNVAKVFPFYSWANIRFWAQIHIYIGLFGIIVFFIHTALKVPHGWLDTTLLILYLITVSTGLIGLYIYRSFPKRLTRKGCEIIYERIPEYKQKIREEVEILISEAAKNNMALTLVDHYTQHLHDYFTHHRNFLQHIFESNRSRYAILLELQGFERYLNGAEHEVLQKLTDSVCQKDDLDYHYALQSFLKYWTFIHMPLGISLALLVILHITAALAFMGV